MFPPATRFVRLPDRVWFAPGGALFDPRLDHSIEIVDDWRDQSRTFELDEVTGSLDAATSAWLDGRGIGPVRQASWEIRRALLIASDAALATGRLQVLSADPWRTEQEPAPWGIWLTADVRVEGLPRSIRYDGSGQAVLDDWSGGPIVITDPASGGVLHLELDTSTGLLVE